jgi:hypothetical protein
MMQGKNNLQYKIILNTLQYNILPIPYDIITENIKQ